VAGEDGQNGSSASTSATPAAPQRRRRWHWSLDVVLAVLVFIGVQAWLTRDVVRGALPSLDAPLVASTSRDVQAWRAEVGRDGFVLYVWATWCAVCKTIEGNVDRVARGAPVLTLAMQSGTPLDVAAELARRGLRWPTLVDGSGALSKSLGVDAVPTLIFVDRHGTVRSVTQGYTTELGIRARLWWTQRAG
jgi:thiol-disulfide isomerase/thioredoxin